MAIEQDEKYTQLAPRPYPLSHTHTPTSPRMQPSYAYPPPQGQAAPDHYRQSPSNLNAPLPPVSLPPLRSIESQAPPASSHLLQQSGNRQMGQVSPSMHGYYGHPQAGLSHPGQSLPPFARYAAIPQGTPIGGSRGKKEIKRRTKTGCLTCRKRRIKCDEEHPACRNCQKSKRECLGYDPIFKQQAGPPPLQPAPGTTTNSASPSPSTATSGAGSYSPAQGVVYPPMPHSYPPTSQSAPVPPSTQANSTYEARAAIDPALARSPRVERTVFEHKVASLPPSDRMDSPKMKPARQLDINQLFQIGQCGPYELTGSVAVEDDALGEIQHYYRNDLAPGLDRLLETDYFTTSGVGKLLATRSLLSEIAELLRHFTRVGGPNMAQDEYRCRATEARAVWHILMLCRPDVDANSTITTVTDLTTPHGRLDVLEALLTNRQISQQNIKSQNADLFWVELAKFLTNRIDDPATAVDTDHSLHQCRTRLSGRENRDVIYSLMVTRHHAWKVSGFPHSMHPESGGESSHVNKVYIAHKFIADEAGYRGTNHPIQRICDMAMRSWAIGW